MLPLAKRDFGEAQMALGSISMRRGWQIGAAALYAVLFGIGLATSATADPRYRIFQAADAKITLAANINSTKTIVGICEFYTCDTEDAWVRTPDGNLTIFAVPGSYVTRAIAVTTSGVVLGEWHTKDGHDHGYLRNPDESIVTFDVPGACWTGPGQINDQGSVVGIYQTQPCASTHSFLRLVDGTIETFDAPNATYTLAGDINKKGFIAGTFGTADGAEHGFIRSPKGKYRTFEIPGSTSLGFFINNSVEAAGSYFDAGFTAHGFFRSADGTLTSFDPPGAIYTLTEGINNLGQVCGSYADSANLWHGFIRAPDGTITTFDIPWKNKTVSTNVFAINDSGIVVGSIYFVERGRQAKIFVAGICSISLSGTLASAASSQSRPDARDLATIFGYSARG
jgi:uncharacterized membrane protein